MNKLSISGCIKIVWGSLFFGATLFCMSMKETADHIIDVHIKTNLPMHVGHFGFEVCANDENLNILKKVLAYSPLCGNLGNLLHTACAHNAAKIVQELLQSHDFCIDPNYVELLRPPICVASSYEPLKVKSVNIDDKITVIKALLATPGIQVNKREYHSGQTALFLALHSYQFNAWNAPLSLEEREKFTSGRKRIISLLINAGINSTLKNLKGKTALQMARENNVPELLELVDYTEELLVAKLKRTLLKKGYFAMLPGEMVNAIALNLRQKWKKPSQAKIAKFENYSLKLFKKEQHTIL